MSRTQEDIKKEFEALLQSHEIDYSRVIALSNELAAQDRAHVRFSVDAGIINRLGKELVGRGETAISELIKNAYDAEASYVKLIFKDAISPGGTLIIEDDGLGMSYEELINGFMRISSSTLTGPPAPTARPNSRWTSSSPWPRTNTRPSPKTKYSRRSWSKLKTSRRTAWSMATRFVSPNTTW